MTELTCTVCCDTVAATSVTTIDSDVVCHGCICHIFQQAIESEDHYPPRWGSQLLRPEAYGEILSRGVIRTFNEKEREYLCPPDERIYCSQVISYPGPATSGAVWAGGRMVSLRVEARSCGTFVGRRLSHVDTMDVNVPKTAVCVKCSAQCCLACGKLFGPHGHVCDSSDTDQDAAAFENLVRGMDYQVCPSAHCERKVELTSGCNHIVCRCGQSFCYICGHPAEPSHWNTSREDGGCPRFHHPTRPYAVWTGALDGGRVRPPNAEDIRRIRDNWELTAMRAITRQLENEERIDRRIVETGVLLGMANHDPDQGRTPGLATNQGPRAPGNRDRASLIRERDALLEERALAIATIRRNRTGNQPQRVPAVRRVDPAHEDPLAREREAFMRQQRFLVDHEIRQSQRNTRPSPHAERGTTTQQRPSAQFIASIHETLPLANRRWDELHQRDSQVYEWVRRQWRERRDYDVNLEEGDESVPERMMRIADAAFADLDGEVPALPNETMQAFQRLHDEAVRLGWRIA